MKRILFTFALILFVAGNSSLLKNSIILFLVNSQSRLVLVVCGQESLKMSVEGGIGC